MAETCRGRDQPLVAHDEAPNVSQPGKGPFHEPPAAVAAQFTPVLRGGMFVVAPGGDHGRDPPPGQASPKGVAVRAPIRHQALGALARAAGCAGAADRDRLEGLFEARDFRRGRRVHGCSQRRTRAIDQHHPRGPLAACRGPDLRPPLFAGMKLPSTTHASPRSFSWSVSWARKARQSWSRMPVSSQCLRRRQQVLGRP